MPTGIYVRTAEHKKAISNALKGKSYEEVYGVETAKRMKETRSTKFKGIKLADRVGEEKAKYIKAKCCEARTGKTYAEIYGPERAMEISKKMSEGIRGKIVTEETKAKISKANKGRKMSEEQKKQLSEFRSGKTYEETYGPERAQLVKERISDALKGRTYDDLFDAEEAERLRILRGNWCRGKTFQEIHGKEKAKQLIDNMRLINLGKTYEEMYGLEKAKELRGRLSERYSGEGNPMFGTTGEKCPSWLGGISFEPYTLDFNSRFKEAIRARDNFCCVMCNALQDDLPKQLHIHHVDYDKLNSFPQNCVSLCTSCHGRTNINRDHWKTFFQSLLKERYDYRYTVDQKVIIDFTEVNKNEIN